MNLGASSEPQAPRSPIDNKRSNDCCGTKAFEWLVLLAGLEKDPAPISEIPEID
jgi:hypothetical protein